LSGNTVNFVCANTVFSLFAVFFLKTLTTLDLISIGMSSQGIQYLADALENNTVVLFFVHVLHCILVHVHRQ
jgi:hypothetical protein